MIPLARPAFGPEEEAAVAEVLRSGWVAQGPTTAAFEEEFARVVGARHAIATSSCTTGLHLAIVAARIGSGDEVILPSFTFPATANAVLYEGAIPVLVDVEPATLNIDLRAVEAAIGPRTKAILGVHLFGAPCAIEELRSLADAKGLFLIEDAACAIGTQVGGRSVGAFGNVACFSLHARKVVTCGEGGMLTTDDDDMAALLSSLRTHGADVAADARHAAGGAPPVPRYVRLGYNYRLSDVQSAIGRVQLAKLDAFVAERDAVAERYLRALGSLHGLRLPSRPHDGVHSWQSFVVVVEPDAPIEPGSLARGLAERGVSTRIGTYAVHCEPYFVERFGSRDLPVSAEAAGRSLALPLFPGMTNDQVDTVIAHVRDAWNGGFSDG